MSDDVLIRCENVGKKFCRNLRKSLWYGVKDGAAEFFSRRRAHLASRNPTRLESVLRPDEFWANKDITFELKRGQCLGLIGHNGAGKTTLLKMLSGLIKPNHGRITIRGRVGGVIALGAGFNPILSGRENIITNAAILGFSRQQLKEKIDEIVDFTELSKFIDSPVQNYSSGMQVRLGFAIATALEPDALLLDEVLAVGDGAFRAKCYSKIGRMMRDTAVVVVSHDQNSIGQMCTSGLLLSRGAPVGVGLSPISEALREYNRITEGNAAGPNGSWDVIHGAPLVHAALNIPSKVLKYGESLRIEFTCRLDRAVEGAIVRATIFSLAGDAVLEWNSLANQQVISLRQGVNKISLEMSPLLLRDGFYDLSFLVADSTGLNFLYLWHRGERLIVEGEPFGQSSCQVGGMLVLS